MYNQRLAFKWAGNNWNRFIPDAEIMLELVKKASDIDIVIPEDTVTNVAAIMSMGASVQRQKFIVSTVGVVIIGVGSYLIYKKVSKEKA